MRLKFVATALAASLAAALPQAEDSGNASLNALASPPIPGHDIRCPQLAPGPVSFSDLAESFPAPVPSDLYAIEAIRQATALYTLAIDSRNFETLRKVFVPNVRVNYSDPIFVLNGVQQVIDTLAPSVAIFASTQHLLGTQYIHICSSTTAVSMTYFQASHFFTPYTGVGNPVGNDQVLIDRSQYQDTWAKQRDGTWKITNRNLVRMGPSTLDGGFPQAPDTSAFVDRPRA